MRSEARRTIVLSCTKSAGTDLTEGNPQKVHVAERKVLLEQEAEFNAAISFGESARIRHVIIGTLPCLSITSLNQVAQMEELVSSDTLRLMGSLATSRRKVV